VVNDILDLSKIEAGKLELQSRPFELYSLLKQTVNSIKSLAIKKRIRLRFETRGECLTINADSVKLKQVVYNLLSNAIKFTPGGKEIGLLAGAENDTVFITVWDQGEGIPPGGLQRIFEPFIQMPRQTETTMGTGLGLSITRRLVTAHGGSISVQSEPGAGSRFTVILPHTLTQKEITTDGNTRLSNPAARKTLSILVVDDRAINLALMKDVLESKGGTDGHELAENGEAALSAVRAHSFSLVLMDIRMPGLNGIDTMRRMRLLTDDATRIVAFTSFAMKEDRDRYLACGFDEHLTKPIDIKVLENLIGRLFGDN
jgi:CheY-like chemotaxis protein/anti-sigma regulatory factor (Ser/Thr protein kinase)